MRPELAVLDRNDLDMIDRESRRVLAVRGARILDGECREVLAAAGCQVDGDAVRFPSETVDAALATVPRSFTIYGKDGKAAVEQSCDGPSAFTTYGPCIRVMKYQGHGIMETREATESDYRDAIRMCDRAKNVRFISTPLSVGEWIERGNKDVLEAVMSFTYSGKHFHQVEPNHLNIHHYFEMEKIIYNGDEDRAREKPLLSVMACPVSPLRYDAGAAQTIIRAGRLGIPVNILSMALAGATAPIFLAGLLVLLNAEVLAGIVVSQASTPGSKVWYGSSSTVLDPAKGSVASGSPEAGLITVAASQLGSYYGIPSFCSGMLTDSKAMDSQSAHERTATSLLPAMSRASAVYGMGALDSGTALSLEQLVIDDEIVSMESVAVKGIPVNEDTVATGIILDQEEGGSFLEHRTTVINSGTVSKASLFDRSYGNHNLRFSRKTVEDLAREKVEEILGEPPSDPLSGRQKKALEELIAKTDSEYRNRRRF